MLQTFDFPAGGRQINAKGTFFRYESAKTSGADDTIRLRVDGNDLGLYTPGDAIEVPDDRPMQVWEILPVGGTTTGTVRVGMGRATSSKLAGVVQVVDSAKFTTIAGLAYMGAGSNTPVAAQFGSVQLYNPANSTRRTIVESVTVNNPSAGIISVGLGWTGSGLQYTGGGSGSLSSKLAGGSLPLCVINQKNDHAADPSPILPQGVLFGQFVAASGTFTWTPKRPIVLPPGYGLAAIDRTANSSFAAVFELYEEAIS